MNKKMIVSQVPPLSRPLAESQGLGIVQKLCKELDKHNIQYCHWKSNVFLTRSAFGENDLDLLVDRRDTQLFTEILSGLEFKQVFECSERQIPGILNYYGYDREADHFVHVHAHYHLVLGHDATKNYHLPIEEAYIASSSKKGIFRIPSVEFELITLVIRLIIKHSTWDTILLGQGKLSSSEKEELYYLWKHVSKTEINKILNMHLPYLDIHLFTACLHILTSNRPLWERARNGQKLLNCLKTYARFPAIVDGYLKIWRRVFWPFEERILRKDNRKHFNSGGLMVAIVGGDGSGKTTAVEEVYNWLTHEFKVSKFHMGKPKWSLLTILIRGIIKIGRSLGLYPFMRADIRYTKDDNQREFPGYPWLIREVCTARDRYITYKKARSLALKGGIVICDRFPIPLIKFMDGPQIEWMTINCAKNWMITFMSSQEKKYYLPIQLPEVLIVLKVKPEIAASRKIDEDASSVLPRSTEIWEADWDQTNAYVIDAGRVKREVISEIKTIIWSHL